MPDVATHQLFEAGVVQYPQRVALVCEGVHLTYAALNKRANQLAILLRQEGVGCGTIIGILVERKPEMIIGIWAILKAGGAYLALDPSYPVARIEYMLAHSGVDRLLTLTSLRSKFADLEQLGRVIDLDDASLYTGEGANLACINQSRDLIYVLYTSGSTGRPKGVMIEHGNVIHLIDCVRQKVPMVSGQTILCLTTICFDIFVVEMMLAMAGGLRVVMAREAEQADVGLLRSLILKQQVEIYQSTPSRLRLLLGDGSNATCFRSIGTVMLGGEALPYYLVEMLQAWDCAIFNLYGPTEATVYALGTRVHFGEKITIGRALPGVQAYVVNADLGLCDSGEEGELLIGGAGLARGYLKAPELTSRQFVQVPFLAGEVLYRTGDLVREMANGEVVYLGRMDRQIKLRGFRIELEEIEYALVQQSEVKEAAVICREGKAGTQYLCGYLVPHRQVPLDLNAIKDQLGHHLPEYMVPSFLVVLDGLPLTPSAKVDWQALPAPKVEDPVLGLKPRNHFERRMAEIWSDVLQADFHQLGIDDDFADWGGNSLIASMLVANIHREFHAEIPLTHFYQSATIRNLASLVSQSHRAKLPPLLPRYDQTTVCIGPEQRGVLFLEQMMTSTMFNIPEIYRCQGRLDGDRLERAFQALIDRHASLRTSIVFDEDVAAQNIHPELDFHIQYHQIVEDAAPEFVANFIRPFDLNHAPLLRVTVLTTGPERFWLLMDMHHIISDGISRDILFRELNRLYAGQGLAPLATQYKDYLVWRELPEVKAAIHEQRYFWLNMFAGGLPVQALTTDFPRPQERRLQGKNFPFALNPEQSQGLAILAREVGATPFMLWFALVSVFVQKLNGQPDIVIGTSVSGRKYPGLENTVGLLTKLIALKSSPQSNQTFREYLTKIKVMVWEAIDNQEYPYESLHNELTGQNERKDGRQIPLFDVMVLFQDTETQPLHLAGVGLTRFMPEGCTAKADLAFHIRHEAGRFKGHFEYDTDLFKASTMDLWIQRLIVLSESVLVNADAPLMALDFRTDVEKQLAEVEDFDFEFLI